jgi:predicted nucleic acid-binding Zn ribbon protein
MTSTRIALQADQALSHASKLMTATEQVPDSGQVIDSVAGGNTASAEQSFHSWLSDRSVDLGVAADELVAAVTQNAGALRQAAQDLMDRDAISADVAAGFTSALQVSTWASSDAAQAVAPVPAPSGTRSATGQGQGSGGSGYQADNAPGDAH